MCLAKLGLTLLTLALQTENADYLVLDQIQDHAFAQEVQVFLLFMGYSALNSVIGIRQEIVINVLIFALSHLLELFQFLELAIAHAGLARFAH